MIRCNNSTALVYSRQPSDASEVLPPVSAAAAADFGCLGRCLALFSGEVEERSSDFFAFCDASSTFSLDLPSDNIVGSFGATT